MTVGRQIMLWRESRSLNQGELAQRAGLTRAYLSRLEADKADPSLSTLRRLTAALNLSIGKLLDESPPYPAMDREALDKLARAVFHPGAKEYRAFPEARILSRAFQEKRAALGLYRPRKSNGNPKEEAGEFAFRRLRAKLGEEVWQSLLRRIDKHAASQQSKSR